MQNEDENLLIELGLYDLNILGLHFENEDHKVLFLCHEKRLPYNYLKNET